MSRAVLCLAYAVFEEHLHDPLFHEEAVNVFAGELCVGLSSSTVQ